jgi:hypothetical protein
MKERLSGEFFQHRIYHCLPSLGRKSILYREIYYVGLNLKNVLADFFRVGVFAGKR